MITITLEWSIKGVDLTVIVFMRCTLGLDHIKGGNHKQMIHHTIVVNNQGENVNDQVICQIVPTMPFDLHLGNLKILIQCD